MQKKIKSLVLKNLEIFVLIFFIVIIISFSSFFNYQKKKNNQNFINIINNIYFKKTFDEIINSLEPRYKKYNHKIKAGETFDNILENYSINKKEINLIKKNIIKKVNINKLNTNQRIQITIDQTNNKIKEFIFQISNTEKIYLSRKKTNKNFDQEILTLKLDKKIVYKENVIQTKFIQSCN